MTMESPTESVKMSIFPQSLHDSTYSTIYKLRLELS